jgi:hypothetical protein
LLVERVVYLTADAHIVAEFVEEVLVRYTITPRR